MRLHWRVRRWLWDIRYGLGLRYFAALFTLGLVFAVFIILMAGSALFIGGLSVGLEVTVSSLLLTIEGILLGLAVLMEKTRIRAWIMYLGILGIMLSLTSVIDGNLFLIQRTIPPPSSPVFILFGTTFSYADLFVANLSIFVVILTGYVIDVISIFWEGEEKEKMKVPSSWTNEELIFQDTQRFGLT